MRISVTKSQGTLVIVMTCHLAPSRPREDEGGLLCAGRDETANPRGVWKYTARSEEANERYVGEAQRNRGK